MTMESGRIQQQTLTNIFKKVEPPNFHKQKANGWLEKPTTTTIKFEFDFGNHTSVELVELFVVKLKRTVPNIGMYFIRLNSTVIDNKHGLMLSPDSTIQVNRA